MTRLTVPFFLLVSFLVPKSLPAGTPSFTLCPHSPPLHLTASKESSGLAPSKRENGFFWIANDSGNGPDLYLVDASGSYQGTLHINKARNTDWEDLDSFSLNGQPFLLIADTGDNQARRDFCTLLIVPEPAFPVKGQILEAAPAWTIRFRYEDGPRDCEAVAVDPVEKKILLLSKRTNPPQLYELPLLPKPGGEIQVAKKTGRTRVERPLTALAQPYGNQVTGLALSPDRTLAAVLTYHSVFLFHRKKDAGWATALAGKPERLTPHGLEQAEAIAFSNDGHSILVLSEGTGVHTATYSAD